MWDWVIAEGGRESGRCVWFDRSRAGLGGKGHVAGKPSGGTTSSLEGLPRWSLAGWRRPGWADADGDRLGDDGQVG